MISARVGSAMVREVGVAAAGAVVDEADGAVVGDGGGGGEVGFGVVGDGGSAADDDEDRVDRDTKLSRA